jgi:hypothetical protein
MVRVREQVEDAREKEFEEIAQLSAFHFHVFFLRAYMLSMACSSGSVISISVNRCQSSLQKAIGEPMQAHQATAMEANLTLTSERLHSLEDKLNSRLDVLTAVWCNPML